MNPIFLQSLNTTPKLLSRAFNSLRSFQFTYQFTAMGEEVRITDFNVSGGDDNDRVSEWEVGLPNVDLTQDGCGRQGYCRSDSRQFRFEEITES